MRWIGSVREQVRARLTTARQSGGLPPFQVDSELGDTAGPVVIAEQPPSIDDGLPRGVRIAGAWAWRLILFVAAA
jgi:hypothetical protein